MSTADIRARAVQLAQALRCHGSIDGCAGDRCYASFEWDAGEAAEEIDAALRVERQTALMEAAAHCVNRGIEWKNENNDASITADQLAREIIALKKRAPAEAPRCASCKHFSLHDNYWVNRGKTLSEFGTCGRWKYGYGHKPSELSRAGVLVEKDEGWGAVIGPDFCCALHEPGPIQKGGV